MDKLLFGGVIGIFRIDYEWHCLNGSPRQDIYAVLTYVRWLAKYSVMRLA